MGKINFPHPIGYIERMWNWSRLEALTIFSLACFWKIRTLWKFPFKMKKMKIMILYLKSPSHLFYYFWDLKLENEEVTRHSLESTRGNYTRAINRIMMLTLCTLSIATEVSSFYAVHQFFSLLCRSMHERRDFLRVE